MKKGNAITPAVNYGEGTGTLLGLTKNQNKLSEDAVAWNSDQLIFRNPLLTPFNKIGFTNAFKFAKNDELLVNKPEGDQTINIAG